MRIDIATLFPEMCERVLSESIIGRARQRGYIELACHQIRDYTTNRQKQVDDYPYGGGPGMVMQAQPLYDCAMSVVWNSNPKPYILYLSPQGKPLTQQKVKELKDVLAEIEKSLFVYLDQDASTLFIKQLNEIAQTSASLEKTE